MSIERIQRIKSKLAKYVFDQKHMDAWFKWLGWVIVTAAISYAWWQTKSHLVLPFVIVSIAYVWVSVHQGLGVFLAPVFRKWPWSEESAKGVAYLISLGFTLYLFVALVVLFVGLFRS
jgi:hypothetical protein